MLALALAVVLTGAALLAEPRAVVPRDSYRFTFVLDITQSMNAKDYGADGLPADRLGYVKGALRRVLHELPCGSEVGLGLFTTQSVHFLFDPIEICEHFPAIDDALSHVDWRMAWAGNSYVAQGLYAAIRDLAKRDPEARLVFLTDGQETPPLSMRPNFAGKPAGFKGAIIGVGGPRPTTVPRYDRENRLVGYWANGDIEVPPVATTDYSEKLEASALPREGPYLSWLDEGHLKELSAIAGLAYHRLETPEGLSAFLRDSRWAVRKPTATDLRPWLGAIALAVTSLALGIPAMRRGRRP
jgi:mxaL protein